MNGMVYTKARELSNTLLALADRDYRGENLTCW
jgi:hypothetical protein